MEDSGHHSYLTITNEDTGNGSQDGVLIGLIPILGLVFLNFKTITKTYAVVGALFIPMLAGALLVLNGRAAWVGEKHKNRAVTSLILTATLLFFLLAGFLSIREKFLG